ncbi:MAG: IS200/IS605 family transposase [Candidatus Thiodiazotropha sp. (ex Ustalcina ferruginea)]|nr:IS200/IS605 family transposase [Candidatus Thiodiazotropha sp. (ex Ustalcina ferruginea)]
MVWVPKYRYRILQGQVGAEVDSCIRTFSEQQKAEIVELSVQVDHVVMIAPKVSVSDYVGTLMGRTAIRVFNRFRELKKRKNS